MLKKEDYLKCITNKLSQLRVEINLRGSINLYDGHISAEDFMANLLNIVFGYQLQNLNHLHNNQPGIDLGDTANGIAFQVTAQKSKAKIQETINKFIEEEFYNEYPQLCFFILQERYKPSSDFDTRGYFTFDKQENILDFRGLIKIINTLETEKLREIVDFFDREISDTDKNALTTVKPDMQVGIYGTDIPPAKLQGLKNLRQVAMVKLRKLLPEEIEDIAGTGTFYLLIRNQGLGVAKFVKIHLELLGYAGTENLPESVSISELSIDWKRRNTRNFVFSGGSEWVLYPQDNASFGFFLEMDTDLSRQLSFRCTVWAENLNEPVRANLELWPA